MGGRLGPPRLLLQIPSLGADLAALGGSWQCLAFLGGNVLLLGFALGCTLNNTREYLGRPEGWAPQPISAAQPASPDCQGCQDSAKHSANVTAMRAKA